jgi:hypothetical protein
MAERLSNGFVNGVNITGSVKTLMTNGIIHIYTGSQPVDADAAETGDLIAIITLASGAFTPGSATNGINLAATSTGGVISKASGEVWSGVGTALAGAGKVAGWFRWYGNARILGASTTGVRLDGAIGTTVSYELQLSNTTIATGSPVTISVFDYTTPKS